MCQLSRMDVIIQPYYLSDNRDSESNELNAISTISDKLRDHKETVAEIKELIYVPMDDKAVNLIQKHGKFKLESGETGEQYVIDTATSSVDCSVLFGNMYFPLVNYTKLEMKAEYETMGLADVINDTWFCFKPINGQPCGCCNPCKYTIEEGMSYRFSAAALKRYKWRRTSVYKYFNKLKRIFKRKFALR